MKLRFVRSAVLLLTVIGIHLSSGYDAIKSSYSNYGNSYPRPEVSQSSNAKTDPSIALTPTVAAIPIKPNLAQPTSGAQVSPQQVPSVYEGCGRVKGCFGYPAGPCVEERSCTALVSFAKKNEDYEFELFATNFTGNFFVAVGISDDNQMGDDSVTECTVVDGVANASLSRNDDTKNNQRKPTKIGLNVINAQYSDGNLYCKFVRTTQFEVGRNKLFVSSQMYYLLLARGAASKDSISYHGPEKTASAHSIKLSEAVIVGAKKDTLVKLHGTFMVAAWMLAASIGMLVARYFKLTWVGQQIMGKDLWFVYHLILLLVTWTLTVIAFILIFVELGGWTSIPATQNPHAVIGLITTLLAFIQPFMAYFRPHPDAPKRFIFNWAHWTVGKSAHTLGIVCIYLAVGLEKAAIPYWVTWLLVVYSVIHVASHIVLTVAQYFFHEPWSRKPTPAMAMKDMLPQRESYQESLSPAKAKEDVYGSEFRRTLLFFYILLVASFSIAVIATIANGPWTK